MPCSVPAHGASHPTHVHVAVSTALSVAAPAPQKGASTAPRRTARVHFITAKVCTAAPPGGRTLPSLGCGGRGHSAIHILATVTCVPPGVQLKRIRPVTLTKLIMSTMHIISKRSLMRWASLVIRITTSPAAPCGSVPAPAYGTTFATSPVTFHAAARIPFAHVQQARRVRTPRIVRMDLLLDHRRTRILASARPIASRGDDILTGNVSSSTVVAQSAPAAALVSSAVDTLATRTL